MYIQYHLEPIRINSLIHHCNSSNHFDISIYTPQIAIPDNVISNVCHTIPRAIVDCNPHSKPYVSFFTSEKLHK